MDELIPNTILLSDNFYSKTSLKDVKSCGEPMVRNTKDTDYEEILKVLFRLTGT